MLPAPDKLPVGMSSFAQIREEGFIYVDKTRLIHQLVTEGCAYFLPRPRRFGKSLLVSTLRQLFQGRRDLFDGLWIGAEGRWDWKPRPVVSLDFDATILYNTPEALERSISASLHKQARDADVELTSTRLQEQFIQLIRGLSRKTGRRVAVLVDEYDKPILEHLDRPEIARANLDILKNILRSLKSESVQSELAFTLITGVGAFSRISMSDNLNHLSDISTFGHYAELLGWTQEEVEANFPAQIAELSESLNLTLPQTLEKLRRKYNGHRFSTATTTVFNPLSLLKCFEAQELENHWFAGSLSLSVAKFLLQQNFPPSDIDRMRVTDFCLAHCGLENLSAAGLLFQTGHTTILDADARTGILTVGYPNEEVKDELAGSLLHAWASPSRYCARATAIQMADSLRRGDVDKFLDLARALFASIPYPQGRAPADERHYHELFYLLCAMTGLEVRSEVLTNIGRMDLAIECPDRVYVIEFKCAQSADLAIAQILAKGYLDPFRSSGKKLFALGINFDPETRNLADTTLVEIA